MHLHIAHETVYQYERPLARSTQYLRLTPRPGMGLQVRRWQLRLPAPASVTRDAYGNVLHVLTLDGPRHEIHLVAEGEVETLDEAPRPDLSDDALPPPVFLRESALTRADEAMRDFAAAHAAAVQADAVEGLAQLMGALAGRMPYTPGATDVATAATEAFASGHGVCQDHAQVFVSLARLLGLPARYVSGYLATDAAHVASHAWAEVRLQRGAEVGWLGFDVSNQCLANGRHVRLAVGLDYLDACPVRGMRLGGGAEALRTQVAVQQAAAQQ
ncbi:transglutaminase family protein [Pelomonas sp. APW6]|uniref:Transglutaminase family protein n=1 Tax=Roseateles subflavus TaxID=3053353 RepID=A0ABT7LFF1_9BURK|nr:transglutaminase family protein [Pelomonas sp. APW6]MDL5030296.1 transglutaminase family protein [Pelomonas sp. APW6]